MSNKIRSAVVVLVLANLLAAGAHALPLTGRQAPSQPEGVLAAVWGWVASQVSPLVHRLWEKAGSQMDPNGSPQPDAGENLEAGSHMDPDGNK